MNNMNDLEKAKLLQNFIDWLAKNHMITSGTDKMSIDVVMTFMRNE
jgi:hypothetical protein